MYEAPIAQIIIAVFLLSTGAVNLETKITFPWRMKDLRNFSLDWRLRKEDFITVFLCLMGVLLMARVEDGFYVGTSFVVSAVISHILIHLRRTSELVVMPQGEVGAGSADLREMYLTIIKRWHPDKATSGEDFFRRNHITALTNRAYEAHDAASLEKLDALKKG